MTEPTNYDLMQDVEIQDLKDIVTTSYQPPDGLEESFPVVGQPMNDAQWQAVTLGLGSGILDQGGQPYWLRLNGSESNTNSTNTMLLTVSRTTNIAQAALRGFYHRLLADMPLSFPGVTSDTTYYVILQYDPAGHQTPGGPITVKVMTALDTTGGKFNVLLWTVARKPNQLLTDAVVKTFRPKISPRITVDTVDALPDPSIYLWGTQAFVTADDSTFRAWGSSEATGGPTQWRPVSDPDWVEYGDTPTYKWPGHGVRRAIKRVGKRRELKGRIMPVDGSSMATSSVGYLVWTIAPGDKPAYASVLPVAGSGSTSPALGKVTIENDEVRLYPTQNMAWLDLASINWEVA